MVGRCRIPGRSPLLPRITAIDRAVACGQSVLLSRETCMHADAFRQGAPRGARECAGVSRGHSTEGDVLYREGPNVTAGSSLEKLGGLALKQLTSSEDLGA